MTWTPKIGDEVWYNQPDSGRAGRVVGFVPADAERRAGQPIIEVLDDDRPAPVGEKVVIHPMFLLPFEVGGPEWQQAYREGRIA